MRITRSPRLIAAIAVALVAVIAVPAVALADTTGGTPTIPAASSHGATIRVTSVSVTAKVVALVNVDFTCQPLTFFDWSTGQTETTTEGHVEGGQFVLLQAQGRTVDWGVGDPPFGTVTCDGSTANHLAVPVTAAVSPWKTGTAVVGASLYVIDANMNSADTASSGPVTVRLSGH
jgi:hypothetical protein